MDDKDIVQFHTSVAAAASELATRKAMRQAGFSDAEIDKFILRGYLQQYFFRRWAAVWVLIWLGFWIFGSSRLTSWAYALIVAISLVWVWLMAWVYSKGLAERHEWVRVRGGWVRGQAT